MLGHTTVSTVLDVGREDTGSCPSRGRGFDGERRSDETWGKEEEEGGVSDVVGDRVGMGQVSEPSGLQTVKGPFTSILHGGREISGVILQEEDTGQG